jgi:hypothetical protein
MLAYTRDAVGKLNHQARNILKGEGGLTGGQIVQTARGAREFAPGDRILFLRNERSLGVKNGTLGTLERIGSGALQVRLDGEEEIRIAVETKDYGDLDYGYASTVHKAQGATVDRTYVLASRYFDRHTSYVALSRHRQSATLFYGQDEFAAPWSQNAAPDAAEAKRQLGYTLSRARPKELAHDYLDPGIEALGSEAPLDNSPAAVQARAREAWMAHRAKTGHASGPDIQAQARERWRAYREGFEQVPGRGMSDRASAKGQDRTRGQDDGQNL